MAVLSKLWIAYIHLPDSSKIKISLTPDHLLTHSQLYHSDQELKTVEPYFE
jgi:hypothetical protein